MDADRRAALNADLAHLTRESSAFIDQIKREGNAFNPGLGVGRALGPDEAIDLRMRCLAQANETAKLGLSRDVYETAERYYRWALGEKPEPKVELPYKTALIALMEAEILGERTDLEKLREETAECFGIVEDRHWPKPGAGDRHFVVQKPDGTIADRADFERLERELDEISDRIVQPITDTLEDEAAAGVLARDIATGRVLSREETDAVAPDISHLVQPITDSLRRRYEAEAQARAVATGGAKPVAATEVRF